MLEKEKWKVVDFRISEGPWYLLDISLKFSIPPDIGGEDPVESKFGKAWMIKERLF